MQGEKEDPRMSLMHPSLFTDKTVLDIGCNSGNLTILLALKHKPSRIDGVDIDERLIKTAVNNLKSTYSLRNLESNTVDTDIGLTSHYYPQSMTFMFGFNPFMPRERAPSGFPYNVHFKSEDWLNVETEKGKYDTILA
jgi:7SK snRNA methylphosphate capping enzyme